MRGKTYRRQRRKSSYVSKGTGFGNARRRRPPKQLTAKQKLYRETKIQVDQTNRLLRNLEREGFKGTWASGKLYGKLSKGKFKGKNVVQKGQIKISKDMSTTNLIGVHKATRAFLESKTSTARGIKDTRTSVIQSLKEHYGDIGKDIDYRQAEVLYNLFTDTDFEDLTAYSSASTLWTNIVDYLEKEIDEETLLDRLIRYGNIDYNNDATMREKVNDLIEYLKDHK